MITVKHGPDSVGEEHIHVGDDIAAAHAAACEHCLKSPPDFKIADRKVTVKHVVLFRHSADDPERLHAELYEEVYDLATKRIIDYVKVGTHAVIEGADPEAWREHERDLKKQAASQLPLVPVVEALGLQPLGLMPDQVDDGLEGPEQ